MLHINTQCLCNRQFYSTLFTEMHAPSAIPVVVTTLHINLANVFNSSHIQLILQTMQFLHFTHSSTKFVCRRICQEQPELQQVTETYSAACPSWKVSIYLYTLVKWKVSLQLQNTMHQLCVLNTTLNVQAKLAMSVILRHRTQSRGKTMASQTKERSHNEGIQGLGAKKDMWA